VLTSLRLLDFRCFESLAIEVPAAGALLVGDNAQGKTSVLEAICILVRLQSPRAKRMSTLNRMGASGFGVAGDPWGVERKLYHPPEGLRFRVDGAPRASQSAYLADGGLIVWMGNEDLELIRGGGESRRRFLDFLGFQLDPAYRRAWSRYRRALKAKNLLLKDGRPRDAEILSYEEILIDSGTMLMESRARMVESLSPLAATAQHQVSGRDEPLTLHYLPGSGPDLRAAILQARERELRQRQSIIGPHRDDLGLRLHGMPAADFASEGQQRTIALALKLAQGTLLEQSTGRLPIYLIDDVFGELDPGRRNALMRHLPAAAQKWITTTHLDWLLDTPQPDAMTRLRVAGGRVDS
jgi:DNA replication and repair protein RecF